MTDHWTDKVTHPGWWFSRPIGETNPAKWTAAYVRKKVDGSLTATAVNPFWSWRLCPKEYRRIVIDE